MHIPSPTALTTVIKSVSFNTYFNFTDLLRLKSYGNITRQTEASSGAAGNFNAVWIFGSF
jgi:hypothetical protein